MTAQATPCVISADPWWTWDTGSIRQTKNGSSSGLPGSRYCFFWARNAIYHCLSLLNIDPGSRVLVPAYICRAAVDPFFAYGADVEFYSIKSDCGADVRDIEARITRDTKAILAAHYFGFPQDILRIREICDRHRIALIEDCAHVFSGQIGGQALGSIGDVAIFSWRKFLPVYDGGELVINRPRPVPAIEISKDTPLFTLRVALNVVERSLRQSRGPALRAAYRGFRALESAGRMCADKLFPRPPELRVETSSTAFDKDCVSLPASRVSRWIKRHSDTESIIARRRGNYRFLQDALRSADITLPFSTLPDSVCPWVLPAFFNGVSQPHRKLRERGIPASAWDDVRHPALQVGCFKDSDYLFENLVFLPVHQCLDERDMAAIASAAKSL